MIGSTLIRSLSAKAGWVGAVVRFFTDKLWETISIQDFGARTSLADNYAAVLAAYNGASAGATIIVPAGVYNFTTPLVLGSKRVAWVGQGARQSVFNYTGAGTTADCFTFGDGTTGVVGARIIGLGFSSSTVMTAGAGVHLKGFCRSILTDVLFDHQDGSGNFWHAAWFDGFDYVTLDGFQARAQQDGIRYNGTSLGKADLFMSNGKVGQCMVGLHAAGNGGGVAVDKVDVINNATNLLIDQAVVASNNREHFFSSTVALDTADTTRTATTYNGICVDIQDTNGLIQFDGTWIATGGTLMRVGANFAGDVKIDGGRFFNAFTTYGGNGNAIQLDGTSSIIILNGVKFANVQGWGVTSTSGTHNNVSLRLPSFTAVTNLVNNCNSGSGVDVLMGRVVGGGFTTFASAIDASPAQTFYQNAAGAGGAMAIGYFAANSSNGWVDFCKSRSATLGAHTIVQTNDALGGINFAGSDGSAFVSSSRIRAVVRGTPAAGDVASRIEFSTTTPGSLVLTARMYLTESGNLIPSTSGSYDLGATSTGYWRNVYAQNIVLTPPASATPANNGEVTFQLTSNTSLTFKVKGSDGTVRSGSIALA